MAISQAGLREMARLYGTPRDGATLVYNGVDLERFHPDTRARLGGEVRASLGLPSGAWVVLFVGSGFERKGLGPLVEAMARIGDARAWLAVAGKGHAEPYQRDAERLGLGGRVVWLGARPDVERLYAAADVVALPARYEPFGNVHLEALASGVPVLSSARAGGSELIRTGDNGWVVGEVTPALIADGLDRLRESDPTRLSAAARRSAEPFTYAAQVDAFTTIHRRLVRP